MPFPALTQNIVYKGVIYPVGATSYPLAAVFGPCAAVLFLGVSGTPAIKGFFVDSFGNRCSDSLSGTIPQSGGGQAGAGLLAILGIASFPTSQQLNVAAEVAGNFANPISNQPVQGLSFAITSLTGNVYIDVTGEDNDMTAGFAKYPQIASFADTAAPYVIGQNDPSFTQLQNPSP